MKNLKLFNASAVILSSMSFCTNPSEVLDTDYSGVAEMYQDDSESFVIENELKSVYNDLYTKVNQLEQLNSPIADYTKTFLEKWLLEIDEKKRRINQIAILRLYTDSMSALGLE